MTAASTSLHGRLGVVMVVQESRQALNNGIGTVDGWRISGGPWLLERGFAPTQRGVGSLGLAAEALLIRRI